MRRALVVEDKDENLYYLTALLGASGYTVESARDGAEALAKARQSPPDVVITDLLMPVMDGYTLLRHWKADDELQRIPFIVYTATYTDPEDEKLALSLGADAFILKPMEPDDFLARLRAVDAVVGTATPAPSAAANADEGVLLREYNETLVRKLEQKSVQLEETNRKLQKDIAAREVAEVALREGEERFRQLAETIEDVFWLRAPFEEKFVYVSPMYEVIWGRSCASLYAAPGTWIDAVHAEDRRRIEATLPRMVEGGWDERYRIVRPDGSIRWIRDRAFPVRDAMGRVCRIAGVSRDITEYRRLEEQLRQAQKMEAVGRLAGGIAHDFNNLLSVILTYAAVTLGELAPSDPIREDMEEIRRAGERATELTRQLLAFSRQQMLRPRVLSLSATVIGIEKMLQRLIGEDVELVLVTSSATDRVHADPSQVEQIVMNLVVNARDAMPRGGKITIETGNVHLDGEPRSDRPSIAPGRYVMLAVTDTGTGIDAATRERIFEPFFTTKETGKGTGLGLSTVFGIVTQSEGHIEVLSEPGAGTTFRIYFPATDRALDAAASVPPTPTSLRGSETVLLVEDDEQVRAMSAALLRRNGYTVLDAKDGADALLRSAEHEEPIHLLLTDVVMPRMSGREVAERLAPRRPAMKVLYVSGYAEGTIVHHGILDPGIAYLEKPLTPNTLLRKVREVLDDAGT